VESVTGAANGPVTPTASDAPEPYASTAGAAAFEIQPHAQRVAELVRTAKAHLGAVIDPDGERATFIDDDWSAYRHERAEVLDFIRDKQIAG